MGWISSEYLTIGERGCLYYVVLWTGLTRLDTDITSALHISCIADSFPVPIFACLYTVLLIIPCVSCHSLLSFYKLTIQFINACIIWVYFVVIKYLISTQASAFNPAPISDIPNFFPCGTCTTYYISYRQDRICFQIIKKMVQDIFRSTKLDSRCINGDQ